ncbi:MAG: 4-(cytidine 5'-diphospho)-2-C-methyl-D-erythritol kinase [Candidatus Marinimicrobia bacterium]|nr:4-(cytidine 5'-diphospho)-2-C-methyl-D-erythritol kinase [Candidatus Neomarinimicrobiota bacterium]
MVILTSHAKLNIGLRILGRRQEDGYHLLETIFQEIDLGDEIRIEALTRSGSFDERFSLTCSDPRIPVDRSNLILKAVEAMIAHLPEDLGARIHLEKRIPMGAGLGGGSSNAAVMLKWLNRRADLDERTLMGIAVRLGADVPFFLKGGTQYAAGIGEILTPVRIPKDWHAVLVFPDCSVSTAWAYKQLRISLTARAKKAIIPSQLEKGFDWRFFENDFEKAMIPSYPEIGSIKMRLLSSGAIYAGLSGSGSTVFGVCESCDKAKRVAEAFEHAAVARPV